MTVLPLDLKQREAVLLCLNSELRKALREDLSNFEHERGRKWANNWKPYAELSEAIKDFDREWADKALKIIEPVVAFWAEKDAEAKRKELIEWVGGNEWVEHDCGNDEHGHRIEKWQVDSIKLKKKLVAVFGVVKGEKEKLLASRQPPVSVPSSPQKIKTTESD